MITRNFYPGDRWLYVKIYADPTETDAIIARRIYPYARKLTVAGIVIRWFFIRYSDPGNHLRVRFLLADTTHIGTVLTGLRHVLTPTINAHIVYDIQLDTYVREIERYGTATMEDCEAIFCHDSVDICRFLRNGNRDDEARCMEAISHIDNLLSNSGLDLGQKQILSKYMAEAYHREFGYSNKFDDLNAMYRKLKDKAYSALSNNTLVRQSSSLDKIASSKSRDSILQSLIHMHVNRLFADNQRQFELIIYHFLVKLYQRVQATS